MGRGGGSSKPNSWGLNEAIGELPPAGEVATVQAGAIRGVPAQFAGRRSRRGYELILDGARLEINPPCAPVADSEQVMRGGVELAFGVVLLAARSRCQPFLEAPCERYAGSVSARSASSFSSSSNALQPGHAVIAVISHVRHRRIRESGRPGGRPRDRRADDGHAVHTAARTARDFTVEGPAALGHRRLSIIDVAGGAQPMSNEDGTIWITYNGELYNEPELRNELEAKGHRYRTACDTESLVHLYEEEGPDFVRRLNGMFALAIWDAKRGRLVLARDRMGQKPLFYGELPGGGLAFGSEPKAVLAHPDDRPRARPCAAWSATSSTNTCPRRIRSGGRSASFPGDMS